MIVLGAKLTTTTLSSTVIWILQEIWEMWSERSVCMFLYVSCYYQLLPQRAVLCRDSMPHLMIRFDGMQCRMLTDINSLLICARLDFWGSLKKKPLNSLPIIWELNWKSYWMLLKVSTTRGYLSEGNTDQKWSIHIQYFMNTFWKVTGYKR